MNKVILSFLLFALVVNFSCKKNEGDKTASEETKKKIDAIQDVSGLPKIMTPEVLWKLGRLSDVQVSPDGKQILYGVKYFDVAENRGDNDLYVMNLADGKITRVTEFHGTEFNGLWRPDGKKIGFLSAEKGTLQYWEMNSDGSDKKQVTEFKDDLAGFKYSPDGKKIIFVFDVKVDKTVQEIYPDLPKANAKIIDDLMYRHWDNWEDEKYQHVFYADYSDAKVGAVKDIMPGERFDSPMKPDGGMEEINWSPDGTKIAYTCKKLYGKEYAVSTNSEIYVFDLASGKTENISDPGYDGYDKAPVFSPDGTKIAWLSMERDGFEADRNRILMLDFGTKQIVELTKGFDQSAESIEWSNDGTKLFFISGIEATHQIYSVALDGQLPVKITSGDHDFQSFSQVGDKFIATKMTMKTPSEIFEVAMDGKEKQISFINKKILDHIVPAEFEKRWVATTDGKKELVWVILPPNFDKTKKYPALLYCQGGPQSAVSQFFSYRWNFQIMASNGYVVVAPNRRGLPGFGQEWNDQISGDYGGQNMNDYLSAIDDVAKEPYIDKDRLGAIGASYGGYSIYWLAGHHQGRFKALISHCGIYDLPSMHGTTEEMFFVNWDLGGAYFDKPQPKSYKDFNPANFVGNWDAPILVITGGNDFRIPYTQSMMAFNAAQLRGVPSRFLFFPEETHFVVQPQNAILWQREFKRFLDENLKK